MPATRGRFQCLLELPCFLNLAGLELAGGRLLPGAGPMPWARMMAPNRAVCGFQEGDVAAKGGCCQ